MFLIPGPFGECRIFCIGAHTVGIWGKNQKQFSAEASRASERGKEIGEIAFDDSDSGERASERVRAWYNLLHVIHNTTRHAHVSMRVIYNCPSFLSLSYCPFLPSSPSSSLWGRIKRGKGRVKERKNERNSGENPPSIKPVYIEFLRRRRRRCRRPH